MQQHKLTAVAMLFLVTMGIAGEDVTHPQLRDELISMREQDQKCRHLVDVMSTLPLEQIRPINLAYALS